MICHTPKHGVWHLSQVSSMFWNKVIISLHEDVLDLQRPLHLVLGLQIKLRLTKIIPHDSPCQKTWGLTLKSSLQHVQNQINNFTPWRCPWPPTTPPPCTWPSDRCGGTLALLFWPPGVSRLIGIVIWSSGKGYTWGGIGLQDIQNIIISLYCSPNISEVLPRRSTPRAKRKLNPEYSHKNRLETT